MANPYMNPLESAQALAQLAQVLNMFGIVGGTQTLLESSVKPETCMSQAKQSLHFMGFGARKWRRETWFREHIERLHRRDGEVRFLIGSDSDVEGREPLMALMREFPHTFEVRIMNDRSLFRLVIIDRHKMLVAHYGHEVIMEDGQNAMGWHSPQLIVEHGSEWSLAIPFTMYYNEVWNRASPLIASSAAIANEVESEIIEREYHLSVGDIPRKRGQGRREYGDRTEEE